MLDPLFSLSFGIHKAKGVYALVLGSGVSRAAGIPTGYEVTLDLIRQVAQLYGEKCEPDPEGWFQKRLKKQPGYSNLLKALGKTPSERNQILKGYFEPTQDERERGLKLPTAAHKAIAALVASGHIKVILTTNFDRLLESALEAVNVNPTIISTPDEATGAVPLVHNSCTIVKLHGDYLDVRIKNTPDELRSYEPTIKRLLNRVLDEYGLIVCGWSAEWDEALRNGFERCRNLRYTTYWTVRGALGDQAKRIVALRRAETIQISNADSFFPQLAEKIAALDQFDRPHPLSKATAVISLKQYLAESRFKIRLHDLVTEQADKVVEEISRHNLPSDIRQDADLLWTEIQRYDALFEILGALMVNGCIWSTDENEEIWERLLAQIANAPHRIQGGSSWVGTQYLPLYPALILLYAGGVATMARKHYGMFRSLLFDAKVKIDGTESPCGNILTPWNVLDYHLARKFPGLTTLSPISDHLRNILLDPLREYFADESDYDKCFDRFEYMRSLVCLDASRHLNWTIHHCPGRFIFRRHDTFDVVKEIENEANEQKNNWPPLLAGLFGVNLERFKAVKLAHDQKLDEVELQLRHF